MRVADRTIALRILDRFFDFVIRFVVLDQNLFKTKFKVLLIRTNNPVGVYKSRFSPQIYLKSKKNTQSDYIIFTNQ